MRFSIRELLLVTAIVALATGWALHAVRYSTLSKERKLLQRKLDIAFSIARDSAQLQIELNEQGHAQVQLPRGWPHSLVDRWQPIPAPSPLPPAGVDYPVARRR